MTDIADQGLTRRQALSLLAALGLAGVAACGSDADDDLPSDECTAIPSETEGPYPLSSILDGTAVVRQNITEGRTGVPLRLTLTLQDVDNDCAALANAAVYIWHCDKDGVYSGYNQPGANAVGLTFLRGVQVSDSNGQVSFDTIYPGWYSGRITHIHFEVFSQGNLDAVPAATSQIAFPEDVTRTVYNSALYAARGQNTSVSSFSQDNVFSDGTTQQMAALTGDTASGYTAALTVGVDT